MSWQCFFFACVYVCWSVWVVVVSLVGHHHYQICTGRHGWFPSTTWHVGSWKKSTIDSLWHPGASFHILLPPVHASFHAAVLLNVFTMWCHMQFVSLPKILWKRINLDILSGWVNTATALNLNKYVKDWYQIIVPWDRRNVLAFFMSISKSIYVGGPSSKSKRPLDRFDNQRK